MPMLSKEWLDDPSIKRWLSHYGRRDSNSQIYIINEILQYIRKRIPFENPSDLIDLQAKLLTSTDHRDRYKILDVIQDYIRNKEGTRGTKIRYYSLARIFFSVNRAELPSDKSFKINGTKTPTRGKLSLSHIRLLVEKADLMLGAVYTTLFSSIMDLERFTIFNMLHAETLANHLKSKGTDEPLLIEFRGRKQLIDVQPYYTFIARQALIKWKEYFEKERGYPSKGEAIALSQYKTPLTKFALQVKHLRLLERLHIIEKNWDQSQRRGYNLHEFRDVARTELHKKGRNSNINLDEAAIEFLMGHKVDPNDYDKFYEDRDYMKKEYEKIEKILSLEVSEADIEDRVQSLLAERDEKIRKLTDELTKRKEEDASVERRFREMEREIERVRKRSEKLADKLP